jgi:uncharacterized membrane protein YfcA
MPPAMLAFAPTDLTLGQFALLIGVGALATAVNTVAGGGSLISFPVLIALGVPSVVANATNAFALTLGGVAGAVGYARSLRSSFRRLAVLLPVALFGSVTGAWLLLQTTERVFNLLVPALILVATLLLALRGIKPEQMAKAALPASQLGGVVAIFAVSVYGGYFGAGMGIAFLAILDIFAPGDLHNHNAIKNWLQCFVNVVAATAFVMQGTVLILPGIALMVGGVAGGYASAIFSQKLDPKFLRAGIVCYGSVATIGFIVRTFL